MSAEQNNNQQPQFDDRALRLQRLQAEKFSRLFLIGALIGITVLFSTMIKIFFVPVVIAAVFAGLFYPFYKRIAAKLGQRKEISALICCLILFLVMLIPAYLIGFLVTNEAIDFYQTTHDNVQDMIDQGDQGVLGEIRKHRLAGFLKLDQNNWESTVQEAVRSVAAFIGPTINKASKGMFHFLANIFLTFFAMFYFFRDGDQIVNRLKYLSPLSEQYEEKLIARFLSVSRATLKGTLLIGLIKGFLGGLTLWIFGIGSPLLWGMVMVLLSVVPMVGPWLVMYPAGGYLLLSGQIWQGILLLVITVGIISNIDNVLMPRLVGREAGMHDLMVFFSTLGGLALFGIMGFIIGPVIAALFLAILDVYSIEFKHQLDISQGLAPNPPIAQERDEAAAEHVE